MENKVKNNMILVQKVDYNSYIELQKENVLPLVIESKEEVDIKGYAKKPNTNLYILKIQYLKWRHFERLKAGNNLLEKDILLYGNGTTFDIRRIMEEYEVKQREEGFLVKNATEVSYITLKELVSQALKEKKVEEKEKEPEKVRITSQAVTLHDYNVIRTNHFLPFIVVLTEFEYREMAKPFDGIYTKLSTAKDGKVTMVIDPFHLKALVDEGSIELNGIELLSGKTCSIDEIYCGDLENNLGGFFINEDEYLSVKDYSEKILNPSMEDKINEKLPQEKSLVYGYWY